MLGHDGLVGGMLLLGFKQVRTSPSFHPRPEEKRFTRYSNSITSTSESLSGDGSSFFKDGKFIHLMVDVYTTRSVISKYRVSSRGLEVFSTRNAEKVWNWITDQLYLEQENKEVAP